MSGLTKFFYTSVGAKMVMAVTGFLLFAFVLGHMAGNLQVFAGADKLNSYAAFLQSNQVLLWFVRASLLVILVLHVWSSSRLTLDNRAARGTSYVVNKPVKASFPSRNMYLTGAMVFFFVAYHLAHFTLGWTHPEIKAFIDPLGRPDVYRMVVVGFSSVWVSSTYIIAMVLLGIHLWHGASSMFQSLGMTRPRYRGFFDGFGPVFASLIVLGNVSMPIAILAGLVPLN